MVKLNLLRTYTYKQISKTIPSTELTEHHAQQLIPTNEMLYISILFLRHNLLAKSSVVKVNDML